jgi:nitrite reductase/ring-hydroxylating ferredoxin subunit
MAEIFVGAASDLRDGQMRLLELETYEIGIYRHQGNLYAYRSQCPHQGGPACEGMIIGRVCDVLGPDKKLLGQTFDDDDMRIVCPWHGWEFRMKDGRNAADPKFALRSHQVFERGGSIYVVV